MKKILFVEDEPHFSRVISFLLGRAGFEVTHCASGEDALKAIDEYVFQCVITDYKMAHVSGLNVAEISRGKWPGIPIFLLTAIPTELLDPACRAVVDEIFIKPVNCDEFVLKVRQSFNRIQPMGNQPDRDALSGNPQNI
jgi:DNA-binding response OmpR family regulator